MITRQQAVLADENRFAGNVAEEYAVRNRQPLEFADAALWLRIADVRQS